MTFYIIDEFTSLMVKKHGVNILDPYDYDFIRVLSDLNTPFLSYRLRKMGYERTFDTWVKKRR